LALEAFNAYKQSIANNTAFDIEEYNSICLLVEKEKVLNNKDVVLSGDRYVEGKVAQTEFESVKVGDYFNIFNGFAFDSKNIFDNNNSDTVPIIKIGNVKHGEDVLLDREFVSYELHKAKKGAIFIGEFYDVFIALSGATTGKISKLPNEFIGKHYALNQRVALIKSKSENVLPNYLFYLLVYGGVYDILLNLAHGAAQPNLSSKQISDLEIPLPPLEVQEEIVREIEGYQKIIDGAKMVVENYKPTIKINPEWEMVELGNVCKFSQGIQVDVNLQSPIKKEGQSRFIRIIDFTQGEQEPRYIDTPNLKYSIVKDDVSMVRYGASTGFVCSGLEGILANNLFKINPIKENITNKFLFYILKSPIVQDIIYQNTQGVAMPAISFGILGEIKIPIPSIEEQTEIVSRIEQEQQLVAASKQLISLFEQKIKDKINEVWGVREE
jgi:type I restriction enzyme M protein